MCIVATTSVGIKQATGFATLYWGAEVVWNIRLRGSIFFLLASARIFSRYINAIGRQGWVEQLPAYSPARAAGEGTGQRRGGNLGVQHVLAGGGDRQFIL